MQANPESAAKYGVDAINQALDGIDGPTVIHCVWLCVCGQRQAAGYSFLPQLDQCQADYVSIEAAQPNLDPAILTELPSKKFLYGVLNLGTDEIETADMVADRLPPRSATLSLIDLLRRPIAG